MVRSIGARSARPRRAHMPRARGVEAAMARWSMSSAVRTAWLGLSDPSEGFSGACRPRPRPRPARAACGLADPFRGFAEARAVSEARRALGGRGAPLARPSLDRLGGLPAGLFADPAVTAAGGLTPRAPRAAATIGVTAAAPPRSRCVKASFPRLSLTFRTMFDTTSTCTGVQKPDFSPDPPSARLPARRPPRWTSAALRGCHEGLRSPDNPGPARAPTRNGAASSLGRCS